MTHQFSSPYWSAVYSWDWLGRFVIITLAGLIRIASHFVCIGGLDEGGGWTVKLTKHYLESVQWICKLGLNNLFTENKRTRLRSWNKRRLRGHRPQDVLPRVAEVVGECLLSNTSAMFVLTIFICMEKQRSVGLPDAIGYSGVTQCTLCPCMFWCTYLTGIVCSVGHKGARGWRSHCVCAQRVCQSF